MTYTRTTLVILLSILVAAASFVAWSYAVYRSYGVARSHAIVRADLAVASHTEQVAEEEERFLMENKEVHDRINSYFITKDTVVSFIEELETLGKHARVKADIARLDTGKENKGPLTLELSILGSYVDIAYYLALLESSPRMVVVDRLALIKGGASGAKGASPAWSAQIGAHVQNYGASP